MATRRRGTDGEGEARATQSSDGTSQDREFQRGSTVRTALVTGNTFRSKPLRYVEVDGLAMFEGDIVLGTVEEVEATTEAMRQEASGAVALGVVVTGANRRWPRCRVPYLIASTLPDQGRVTSAIAHWEANTNYRFIPRTTEPDYVTFRPSGGCSSPVGRRGGEQFINLGPNCTLGNTIHEIGHAIGLWHEQSREDRDLFVEIHFDKIAPNMEHNFDQHITDGDDVGAYDYGSIMHYPRNAFSIDGSDTITPVDPGAVIGQRAALSAGDIAAANSLCTAPPGVPTIKEAPRDTVKEAAKDAIFDTRKELAKDVRLDTVKEQIRDTAKEMLKERVKEIALDPGPGTFVELPVLPGQPPFRPGFGAGGLGGGMGARPFAVMAGTVNASAHDAAGDAADEQIAHADSTLQQLAALIARLESEKSHLQSQYDEVHALLQRLMADRDGQGDE